MAVLFALLALAASANVAPESLCQTTALTIGDQQVAWVNLIVDDDGRRLDHHLYMRGDGFEGKWALGPRLFAGRNAMAEFEIEIEAPAGTAFPVTLKAFADGRLVWFRRVSDGRLFMEQSADNPIPNLRGTRRLRLVAEDAAGRSVARQDVAFPDWERLERGTARAMRINERIARGGGCVPSVGEPW